MYPALFLFARPWQSSNQLSRQSVASSPGVPGVILTVQWPIAFAADNRPLLYIYRRPLIDGIEDVEGRCKIDEAHINTRNLIARPTEPEAIISKRQIQDDEEEDQVRKNAC